MTILSSCDQMLGGVRLLVTSAAATACPCFTQEWELFFPCFQFAGVWYEKEREERTWYALRVEEREKVGKSRSEWKFNWKGHSKRQWCEVYVHVRDSSHDCTFFQELKAGYFLVLFFSQHVFTFLFSPPFNCLPNPVSYEKGEKSMPMFESSVLSLLLDSISFSLFLLFAFLDHSLDWYKRRKWSWEREESRTTLANNSPGKRWSRDASWNVVFE